MLNFSAIGIDDKPLLDSLMQQDGTISSIRTFTSLYVWGEHFQTCFCMEEGILFFKACYDTEVLSYYMPLGGDLARAVELIEQDAAMLGMEYELTWLTEAGKQALEALFPGKYTYLELRDDFEYIYNAQDMIALKGKKYHGKRNFINRFKMNYNGRWEYAPVDPAGDYDEIMAFVRHWCEAREDEEPEDYRYEYSAIMRALRNYDVLDIRGGLIRLDGKIIAFTLASPQNAQAMDILIEKADADIEGAYQMINNQFAMRECDGFTYVNREEDMGIEGLRQAKLSYHPAFLTAKYKAVSAR